MLRNDKSSLALLGGEPLRHKPYPPYVALDEDAILDANTVLRSGLLSGFVARGNASFLGGAKVRQLEQLLTETFDVKFAVSMNSATSALHAAMIAAGVGPGDEVIVPPITMSATAAAVMMCKATPIFADVEPDTYCIDPEGVEKLIGPRTRAIIAVNIFGMPADLHRLRTLADHHDLILVEDNAQAPGAKCDDSFAGTVGHMGVLSFNHHKAIHSGEGGAVLTNDDDFARRLRLVRNHGEVVLDDWDRIEAGDDEIVGYNYRLTEIQAALLVPQLRGLRELTEERMELAQSLSDRLCEHPFLSPVKIRKGCSHAYYLYPIQYSNHYLGLSRSTFMAAIAAEGVHLAPYVKPVHHLPIFQRHRKADHPRFSRLFPGRNTDLFGAIEPCPVAVSLSYESLMVTNICRSPNTLAEIDEFMGAVDKVAEHAEPLRAWERESKAPT